MSKQTSSQARPGQARPGQARPGQARPGLARPGIEKPGLPKGTRDFGPEQMAKRNFILDTIRAVYQNFGFLPLETPSMENLSVLTGKYGDEGDKLLFRVLESGDFFEPVKRKFLEIKDIGSLNDFFENSLHFLIKEILREDIRDYLGINNIITNHLNNFYPTLSQYAIQIDQVLKEKLENFLKKNSQYIAYTIYDFIIRAAIYKDTEDQKVNHHLKQYKQVYINDEIIPSFEDYLIKEKIKDINSNELTQDISKKGLRYDLTVPFARYVVMNQHEITFPFKRYQIQPVWRADRPQKGRYREFYQCDADVVGTDSLICEAEIILMIEQVFQKLGIEDFTIKVNNRKILQGLVEAIGAQGKENDLLVAIDKLDKIGQEKVMAELRDRGFTEDALQQLLPIFQLEGNMPERLSGAQQVLQNAEIGQQGLMELQHVFTLVHDLGSAGDKVQFDITLARGLSYYTGAIFEVKVNNSAITSSVSGGGRYDNLTGVFGLPGVSGVGISFGVDRIYDVMEDLNLFPQESMVSTQVLLVNFDRESEKHALQILSKLRHAGIRAEIYPESVKLKKQFAYADKKGIPYIIVAGAEEIKNQRYGLKDLKKGEQVALRLEEIIVRIKQ